MTEWKNYLQKEIVVSSKGLGELWHASYVAHRNHRVLWEISPGDMSVIHFTSAMLVWLMTVAHRLGERPVRSDSEIFAAWKRIGLLRAYIMLSWNYSILIPR